MELIAFIVTVFVGLFGTVLFGNWINWPEGGMVFAIAVMGSIILWFIRHPKNNSKE